MILRQISKLAGKVPTEEGKVLTTTSNPGGFRLSPKAAAALGVTKGDHVEIGGFETENGIVYCIYKASNTSTLASKLAYASAKSNTGSLMFSLQMAYKELGGNSDTLVSYELGEGQKSTDENGTVIEDSPLMFVLTKLKETPKQERKKKADKEGTEGTKETEQTNVVVESSTEDEEF